MFPFLKMIRTIQITSIFLTDIKQKNILIEELRGDDKNR